MMLKRFPSFFFTHKEDYITLKRIYDLEFHTCCRMCLIILDYFCTLFK